MPVCEIHLNRRTINSIELPAQALAEAGKSLVLTFNNHGHPLHVSLSAMNPARFTSFTHENLFIQGETQFEIPIFEDAEEGAFTLEVVTGYGRTKGEMKVLVRKPLAEQPEPKPVEKPAGIQVPWARVGPIVLGLILYAASFQPGLGILKDLAFLVLLAALLLPWLQQG
ncbi:MAG TPA: hypothetical protein VMS81_06780 [Methanomicrobiales archaeon]|jgi:hypothetical protein|nr:hypothetical protein [Methanomicrobiales archaeon]